MEYPSRPRLPVHGLLALVLVVTLAGCSLPAPAPEAEGDRNSTSANASEGEQTGEDPVAEGYRALGFNGTHWPRLDGVTLTILDHGAFGAFEGAKGAFENLTGARVEHVSANDAGSALNRAAREKGDPTFDVIYGVDNVLWTKALEEGIFEAYKPLLAERISADLLFFDANGTWWATPVDHGYIGLNVDPAKVDADVATLDDVLRHADQFVTQDPRTSTPGLGFLLATIATYGESGWKGYWTSLFENGLLVTSGWTEAYVQHFSAGYGIYEGGAADRAIVTSYTTSPAYEAFFGRAPEDLAREIVAPKSTFHQIETMGIVKGTDQLAAAQAWIEFTLTDEFQSLMAPGNAVYPVVRGVETESTFAGHDPAPGSFEPAEFTPEDLGANVERWIREWTDLCEQHDCA